jgi:putative ATP-dependent endonuclease of OLD family
LQVKLLQFINAKIKTEESPNGVQCILTTHSPNITSKADPSEIIMLASGNAWPLRVGETELEEDDYIFLRKFLDATKANVFFAKGILFVEGDGDNILLPEIAKLIGRPLENHGVSIVKYDNSGSWKRFARLFLRKDQDGNNGAWHPTKVCVLRDLDLWPDCSEEKDDGSNPYGFKKESSRNKIYWRRHCEKEAVRKAEHIDGLSRQNVVVKISDDWTFEYCLAKYGLFSECYEAIKGSVDGITGISGSDEEKATWVIKEASKTDFAYKLSEILRKQLDKRVEAAIAEFGDVDGPEREICDAAKNKAKSDYASELEGNLPPYIVEAIKYVTTDIAESEEEQRNG